ncbi:hypothetical protein [Bacillus massilinigeriensis]|uniref:hypothetical protein n=1 Tax=Bacillus massilionigeriensis TaxID=1805475 RepID=UPI00096B0853|nr:hypothetical protein [Bacillus massilionigeriensis]
MFVKLQGDGYRGLMVGYNVEGYRGLMVGYNGKWLSGLMVEYNGKWSTWIIIVGFNGKWPSRIKWSFLRIKSNNRGYNWKIADKIK